VLARIIPRLPRGRSTLLGPGDDAAVIAVPGGRALVTTDMLVEDRHFRRAWSSGADIGWRAAMQNLADIAAMGAHPHALVVALAAPGETEVRWLVDLADGLAEAAALHGVGVVGGDLSGGDRVVVAVTAFGACDGVEPVTRSGARPGDVLALAGSTGWSAAGLAALEAGVDVTATGGVTRRAVTAFRRPRPPIEAGALAAGGGARAMLDISDGLMIDASRLAEASGASVHVDGLAPALAGPASALSPLAATLGRDPWAWVLTGGEDHALLATFPAGASMPSGFAAIGHISPPDDAGPRLHIDGNPPMGRHPASLGGWDHFASRREDPTPEFLAGDLES
jgi:thiamine-monophosphate kinase